MGSNRSNQVGQSKQIAKTLFASLGLIEKSQESKSVRLVSQELAQRCMKQQKLYDAYRTERKVRSF